MKNNIHDASLKTGGDLTPCQKEYAEKSRNWLLKGRYLPRCKTDGSYSKKQCHKSYCFCVNKDGGEIYGSRKNVSDGDLMCGPDPGDSNEYTLTQLPRPSVIRTTLSILKPTSSSTNNSASPFIAFSV